MKILLLFCGFALSACAAVTTTEGILSSVNSGSKSFDRTFLERQCDLEDIAACYFLKGQLPALPRVPIVQGVAGPDRAVFAVLQGPLAEPRYFLREKESQSVRPLPIAKTYSRENSPWRLERLELFRLAEDKSYELLITDRMSQLVDVRGFKALREKPEGFRFAFVAGTDDKSAGPEENALWESLLARQPRLLLGLGNLVSTSGKEPVAPAALWDRYAETRASVGLFRQPELVPLAATWGPQDFGAPGSYAGRENPNVDAAREIQEAFFPSIGDAQAVAEGPGIAKALRVANQTFVLMDSHSFREGDAVPSACREPRPSCPAPAPSSLDSATHFGRLEQSWAVSMAAEAKGAVWFLSDDPWFGGAYATASFEGNHPVAFAGFREQLNEEIGRPRKGAGPVALLFGSANPFFAEAKPVKPFPKIAYGSMEFSTPPFRGSESASAPAPEKGAARASAARYLFFTTWPSGEGIRLSAEAVEAGNRAGFAVKFEGKPVRAGKSAVKRSRKRR